MTNKTYIHYETPMDYIMATNFHSGQFQRLDFIVCDGNIIEAVQLTLKEIKEGEELYGEHKYEISIGEFLGTGVCLSNSSDIEVGKKLLVEHIQEKIRNKDFKLCVEKKAQNLEFVQDTFNKFKQKGKLKEVFVRPPYSKPTPQDEEDKRLEDKACRNYLQNLEDLNNHEYTGGW